VLEEHAPCIAVAFWWKRDRSHGAVVDNVYLRCPTRGGRAGRTARRLVAAVWQCDKSGVAEGDALSIGRRRQADIYLAGVLGRRQRVPFTELEKRARRKMSREAFAYVAGGAGSEQTIRSIEEAFEGWAIVPRMLRDVSVRDTSVELFGRRLPGPFLIAPIGVLEMAHRDADLAVARAAASAGVPMIFSSQASRPMEDCAPAMGDSPRRFQSTGARRTTLSRASSRAPSAAVARRS